MLLGFDCRRSRQRAEGGCQGSGQEASPALHPRRELRRANVQEAGHCPLPGEEKETLAGHKISRVSLAGARDPPDQGGLQHEAGRVGWAVQDRPGGQGQEGRQVLCSCGELSERLYKGALRIGNMAFN